MDLKAEQKALETAARAATVDALGAVKAQIAALKDDEEGYKSALVIAAADLPGTTASFEGVLYRATVSFAARKVVDKDAVIAALATQLALEETELKALLAKHTESAVSPTVRVSARKS